MAEWFRGKRILIVDEDYVAASRLETRLLHYGALVKGPASTFDEALRCLVFDDVDAAVLSLAPISGTCVMISDVLSRLGIPFVFRSRETNPRLSEHYSSLVGKPGEAQTMARLLARNVASEQDNIPKPIRHLSNEGSR